MDYERLPRKMLSSWVAAPRPRGAPPMTYRRSIEKALANFNVKYSEWPALAADREAWRSTLLNGAPPGYEESPPTPPPAQTRPRRTAADATNRAIDKELGLRSLPPRPPTQPSQPPAPPQRAAPTAPPRRSARNRAATPYSFSEETAILNAWQRAASGSTIVGASGSTWTINGSASSAAAPRRSTRSSSRTSSTLGPR